MLPKTVDALPLSQAAWSALAAATTGHGDEEVCGLLFGSRSPLCVDEVAPLPNAAVDIRNNFVLDPVDVLYAVRRNPREWLGTFHTHPEGAATFSADDERGLSAGLHIVVATRGGQPRALCAVWSAGTAEQGPTVLTRVAGAFAPLP